MGQIILLSILFICLANSCRSPMAECIMKYLVRKNQLNWICDSAALRPWNVGGEPANRCLTVLKQNGMKTKHLGRIITKQDFQTFDYILGMDQGNIMELQELAQMAVKNCRAKIELLGSYLGDKEREIINDPYFSKGMDVFCNTYKQIHESCQKFIEKHRMDNGIDAEESLTQEF